MKEPTKQERKSEWDVLSEVMEILGLNSADYKSVALVVDKVLALKTENARWIERLRKLEARQRHAVDALLGAISEMDLDEIRRNAKLERLR